MEYQNPNCDSAGSNGACTPGTVRRYPLSEGNAIVCLHHWAEENKARFNERAGAARHDWATGEVYA